MKNGTILRTVLLVISGAALTFAADVTGKWSGEFSGPNGSITLTYDLKQDGAKLTGSTQGPAGSIEIQNGKVDGDKITFTISFEGQNGAMTITEEGVVSGDEITLNMKMEGGPEGLPPLKLKRVK